MTLRALILVTVLACPSAAHAQAVRDFYNRAGVALYNPEIAVAYNGVLLNARPVVSADRKYVTIGVQTQTSRIVSIEKFPVAQGVFRGYVGGVLPGFGGGSGGETGVLEGVDFNASLPVQIRSATPASALHQTGMFWIAPP